MSAYLYDQALVDRLRSISGDDRIHIIPPEEAISFLAQLDEDKVQYPAIVVTRGAIELVGDTRNQVAVLKGQTVRLNDDNTVTKIKLLPMKMEWSVNVFAADRFTCDEIIRELVFYFMSHPRFSVKVPYSVDVTQNFDVFVGNEIADNSDLIEFPNKGTAFRETITLYTENAHLYSSGKIYISKADPDVKISKS